MLSHFSITRNTLNPFQRFFRRSYQSEKGVYGYRPLQRDTKFKVSEDVIRSRNRQSNAFRLVEAYRKHGHKLAAVNPIAIRSKASSLDILDSSFYGLKANETVNPFGLLNTTKLGNEITIADLETALRKLYCSTAVSAEFSYIECTEENEWLATHFEQLADQAVSTDARKQIAALLIKTEAWENFMALKFPSVKRYGGEGAESMLAFWWQLFHDAVGDNLEHIVVGMNHRGRTGLQIVLMNTRPAKIFRKLTGESEFRDNVDACSDVVSHFHSSEELKFDEKNIRLSLIRNPSHLEAVNPVAMGKTRSKQQTALDGAFSDDPSKPFASSVLSVLVHGDAAFAGQGVNQECLNMAYVPHFEVGGTIHFITNNQLGFTTPAERGRSTEYTTDLAKTIQAPVFHVNGDDPEMLALVTSLALKYQRKFRKDVFIDLNCYRRRGHNEIDDPTFTNPSVYQIVNNRKSVPEMYIEKLIGEGVLTSAESEKIRTTFTDYLSDELSNAAKYVPEESYFQRQWTGLTTAPESISYWDTGLDFSLLNYIGRQSVAFPSEFNVHPHLLKTHIEARKKKLDAGEKIDWATAEALAIGSLMYQGHNVRISGEDVGRGTFSQRHAMLVDQQTNEMLIPLNDLKGGQGGKLEVAHSILSEEGVLGFEYGMAIDNPNNLIIWEAQFGDFANCAQIMFDNFIVSGETKWMDSNGLVILLPHGYDGAAAEHSSCRMERFLLQCDSKETAADSDNVNLHIVNPTTPAQYFHVLRRQMLRNFRKPLVVVSPKTLLRLSAATSTHRDFEPGTHFRNVLGDDTVSPQHVRRVVLCSGKHYYSLADERTEKGITDTAIIRLESLSPFPVHELQQELDKFKNATTYVWSQEEHRNMGAWTFVRPRFEHLIGKQMKYCGRNEAAASATGIGKVHKQEMIEIVTSPFRT